ncbi:MAG: hypothetical protein OEM77_05470, partial [Nitrosopumilus sp.]|nr:hypothetical protein [Nitrosopumilus sp.]MDH3735384.1 hypothetical protein [Nitrosopumilus sp.]
MTELTIQQAIERIDQLIDAGRGDAGRLDNIRESLRNNKTLFNSDTQYLEKLLESSIVFRYEEPPPSPLLPHVKKLIDSGSGDHGRLQSIYDSLLKGKSLYQSDSNYLQKKLNESSSESDEIPAVEKTTLTQTDDKNQSSQDPIKTSDVMPKGWNSNEPILTESIKTNQNEIAETNVKELMPLDSENPELTKIRQASHEQEKQIEATKDNLESQIKIERERIASQIKLFEQITSQKAELEKVKIETSSVLNKIKKEREVLLKESELQKEDLIRVQKEQEEIERKIQQDQINIEEMRESQKFRLHEHTELLKQLQEKKFELEETQNKFDEIQNELKQEKQSLEEQSTQQKENLSKLEQEKQSLEKTQTEYDDILSQIE